jgi:hypothetical protein
MTTERFLASCNGKHPFATKSGAMDLLARRRKRAKRTHHAHKNKRSELADIEPYRCRFCHHWHIGRDPQS